jgi:AcrR family transcriptional regulator
MVSNGEVALPQGMKIAQLCKESGLTRSTIHHYVNLGLLHRPRQAGLNLHLFDESHLNRLRQIRRLRENEKLPLAQIKELLDRVEPRDGVQAPSQSGEGLTGEVPSGRNGVEGPAREPGRKNREMILDAAIRLFSEQGYENTRISDITDALHMGKGTFYVYFKNKKELFMECIDRLAVTIVPKEAWAEIRSEKDYDQKTRKRGAAFLNAFPGFRGILNLLRIALGGPDRALAVKAREAFRVMSAPMAKDLNRAISEGLVRPDVDVDLFAFLQLMLAEGLGYWLMMDADYSIEEGLDVLLDIFGVGLRAPTGLEEAGTALSSAWGELRDSQGVSTPVKDVLLNGNPLLSGRIGDGEMGVDLARTRKVEILLEGEACLARATLKDGNEVQLEVEGGTSLSAETPCGPFRIPLERVVRLSLAPEKT